VQLAWVLTVVLWVLGAGGQQVRSVRGTVTDQNGHALAGAVVQIQDRTTFQVRSYRTQEDGYYHFEDLFSDLTYHLRANYAGVSSRSKILSKFDSDRVVVIDLKIQVSK
jgi:hypothetical protein